MSAQQPEIAGTSILLLLSAIPIACGGSLPRHEEFRVGMSREEIAAHFGHADRIQALTKSDESIWGPIESFWSGIPMGARVEIWAFQSTMNEQPGQTELYFVDDADAVDGIGFQSEGAVYEGTSEPSSR